MVSLNAASNLTFSFGLNFVGTSVRFSKVQGRKVKIATLLQPFYGFADAAYADNYKSTSGYVFLTAGRGITCRSKKTTLALSSTDYRSNTEAEYVALPESGREAC